MMSHDGSDNVPGADFSEELQFGQVELGAKTGLDSKAPKAKHHPSFTLILRKQMPFCLNSGLLPGNEQAAADGQEKSEITVNTERNFSLDFLAKSNDFEFVNPWQIWILDESTSNSDWKVKKRDGPTRTGRQFWSVYSELAQVFEESNLKNLMIFQDQVEPKWEDKTNVGGGRWYFDVSYTNRTEGSRGDYLLRNNYWTQCLQVVLSGCLGPVAHLVVGLILNFKSCKNRVSLWTRSCNDFNQVIQLGTSLRNRLNLRCQLKFELHSPTATLEQTSFQLN